MTTTPPTPTSAPSALRLLTTGYVSQSAGSVAGANSVILRELLRRGTRVAFHSKPGYVDPRPLVEGAPYADLLTFTDCTNGLADTLHRRAQGLPGLVRRPLAMWDDRSYRRTIANSHARAASAGGNDLAVWLGTWAYRRTPGLPTVSFVQGAPGTDARSVARHRETIIRLAGRAFYHKAQAYAAWRLRWGLPPFHHSDRVIVGSSWSRGALHDVFGLPSDRVFAMPYPIDLDLFSPPDEPRPSAGPLRVLWVGRFAPRKRLDLFLDGLALAIREGVDAEAVIVGRSAFVPNYERLLAEFPHQERLTHHDWVNRVELPALMATCDILSQPSDEEDFGSSVAESQGCGMPAIVGATNGTGDYVCERSIRLTDDRPETYAAALAHFAEAKRAGELADPTPCRESALSHFDPPRVVDRLVQILREATSGGTG